MANELMSVQFESLSGIPVSIDADTVRKTLTRGNGKVTDQEVSMFLRTCQAKRLDPFENGEVWLIKYGDSTPANLVVGYFAYIRRADKFPDYRGFKAGICVAYKDKDENFRLDADGMPIIKKKEGAAVYSQLGEVLIGGWCEVLRERIPGHIDTSYMEVTLAEYSTGKSNWTAKPATMIRKVAVSQAFRAAFPNEYEGLYTEDEMVASGAIPAADYTVDPNTGEITENKKPDKNDDDVITQEQRRAMFNMAQSAVGKDACNELVMHLIREEGYEATHNLPTSVYKRVIAKIMEITAQQDAEAVQNQDAEDGTSNQ